MSIFCKRRMIHANSKRSYLRPVRSNDVLARKCLKRAGSSTRPQRWVDDRKEMFMSGLHSRNESRKREVKAETEESA